MWLKKLLLAGLLTGLVSAQEVPKTRVPLPSRVEIANAGWTRFDAWCVTNVVDYTPANKDKMARLYQAIRDEITANQVERLPQPAVAQLEAAYGAVAQWISLRAPLVGATAGPWLAQMADLKHECFDNWNGAPDPSLSKYWPDSLQEGGAKGDKQKLAAEAVALSEASKQVRKVMEPSRQALQQFMLKVSEQLK
ncbi:hypothetical protein JST97_16135 [bacterium]|nr:hypothetical protein [bacterium]